MPSKGTPPVQMRLTPADREVYAEIQRVNGLPSLASAVRWAGQYWKRTASPDNAPKKRRTKSEETS
jgi:hypothetical protein